MIAMLEQLLTGRQVRHVVVGSAHREQPQPAAASRIQSNRSSTPRELARVSTDGVFLSIYKSKVRTNPFPPAFLARDGKQP